MHCRVGNLNQSYLNQSHSHQRSMIWVRSAQLNRGRPESNGRLEVPLSRRKTAAIHSTERDANGYFHAVETFHVVNNEMTVTGKSKLSYASSSKRKSAAGRVHAGRKRPTWRPRTLEQVRSHLSICLWRGSIDSTSAHLTCLRNHQ